MKKKLKQWAFHNSALKKTLRIMRWSFFLLIVSIFQAQAISGYAQKTKLSLDFKNASVTTILNEIEDNSEFYFLCNRKLVDLDRKTSIQINKQTIEEILTEVFKGTDVKYTITGRQIVLSPGKYFSQAKDSAQPQSISGKVTDSEGKPLPGVTIVVKGTTNGTVTNTDGEYSLANISNDASLLFSFVGMKTQEIAVAGKTNINVVMEEDAIGIEEVVAVGYGIVKKSDLTSAIAKVEGDALEERPVSRLDQALQGQLAGVHVQQSGGKPGKNANIRIRGVASITAGVDPLYVVDGFPVDGTTFANMNLNNIESIEVLKDAASAAIYGSRGSNGVIIVTTKKGKKGQELRLDLNVYTGISNIERRIEMLNASEQIELIADEKDGKWVEAGGDLDVLPLDRSYTYRYDQNWLDDPDLISYDHLGVLLQTGFTQSYSLSASGSTTNTRYLISGEYFDQSGIVKNTSYTRYSARASVDANITDFLEVGLNLTPMYVISQDKDTEGQEAIIHRALISSPLLNPRLGYWGESDEYSTFLLTNHSPSNLALIEHLNDKQIRTQVLSDIYARVNLLPGLNFKTSFGANLYNERRDVFRNQIIMRDEDPEGEYTEEQCLNWISENILNFAKTLNEKHQISALLGYTVQKEEYKSAYIEATGYANDYVSTLNAATTWTASTTMEEWALISYLGRINYSFSNKYLLAASLRRDGSSRFGANNKWGWFPSVSGAWRIDQEGFMKRYPFIDQLKLRVSYGQTGNNNIGNYSAIGSMETTSYLLGTGETITAGAYQSSISNPNLSWEKTSTIDFGLDLKLLNSRISLSADYYNSQTSDLLLEVPVPVITGFSSEIQNYGKVENKGWDFELHTINTEGNLKWTSNLNLSFLKNKVLQLGPNNSSILSGFENTTITKVGQAIGSFYMYKQTGVYNTEEEIETTAHADGSVPGDVIIEDYNNDGEIDSDDRQLLGNNIPKCYWGLTNQFNYKGIDLSIFFNGVLGNHIFNTIGRQFDRPQGAHNNKYKHWVNRWRSAEDPGDGMTPRMWGSPTGASSSFTSRMIYKGDFIRLKNITLGYTFPKRIVDKLKLSRLRAYVQAENLYCWDYYYVGFTPEVDLYDGDPLQAGSDYGHYPTSRTFLFGLNVSF